MVGMIRQENMVTPHKSIRGAGVLTADAFAAIVRDFKQHENVEKIKLVLDYLADEKRRWRNGSVWQMRKSLNQLYQKKRGPAFFKPAEIAMVLERLANAGCGQFEESQSKDPTDLGNFVNHYALSGLVKKLAEAVRADSTAKKMYSDTVLPPQKKARVVMDDVATAPAPVHTRAALPRLTAPTEPVVLAAKAPKAVSAGDHGTVLVQIRGCEFELDLTKVPSDLLKFRRML